MKIRMVSCLVMLMAGVALGQSAGITGLVKDQTGAALPGATVVMTNVDTGIPRTTLTNDEGYYLIRPLQPGNYRITVQMPGFKPISRSGIKLEVQQMARLDFTMELGELAQAIDVIGAAPLLETESASLGQVINNKQIIELPLNGRNFVQLAHLSSGVVPATGQTSDIDNRGLGISYHSNGTRQAHNAFLLDGIDITNLRFGASGLAPSIDAIREFKVQQNAFSAEFGQAASIVNISIKSGTNEFHGGVFEFLRNERLDARSFFDRRRPPLRMSQFGGTFGGPILRDKSFFFGNYEGLRTRRSQTQFFLIPMRAQLSGDFRGGPQIFDPLTFDPATRTRQPFPDNIIPPNRISRVAKVAATFWPEPNISGDPGRNFVGVTSAINDFDQFHARIDHNFSETDVLFGRFSMSNQEITLPSALHPLFGLITPLRPRNAVVQEVHTFNTRLINEFRVGYTYSPNADNHVNSRENLSRDLFGFKNVSNDPVTFGLPQISIQGLSGFGPVGFRPAGSINHSYQLIDALSYVKGKHSFKFGGDIRRRQVKGLWTFVGRGALTFTNRYTNNGPGTGSALADFLLGYPSAVSVGSGDVVAHYRSTSWNFFLQDDIKLHPRVTLNLGLRYEYNTPWVEKRNQIGIFDFKPGRFLLAGKDLGRNVQKADKNNWAPRIGLAWRVTSKTAVRVGAGIFYAQHEFNETAFLHLNPPFFDFRSLAAHPTVPDLFSDELFPAPSPTITPQTGVFTLERDFPRPIPQQWNLNIQHEPVKNLLVEVGYAGNTTAHLNERYDPNQAVPDADPTRPTPVQSRRPFPNIGTITLASAGAVSTYHAFQAKVEKRFTQGAAFLASYTFSRAIEGSATVTFNDGVRDSRRRRAEKALARFDARQRLVFSYNYELPFGPGKRFLAGLSGWGGKIVGGWQMNGITAFQSGNPLTPLAPGTRNNSGSGATHPDRLGEGNLPRGQRTPERYFDTSAFVLAPFGSFGNAGRNILIGPGINNWDVSLFKNTAVAERLTVQFRAEFFNAFNHAQFGLPVSDITSPAFGRIFSARPGREIQFGLKLIF